MAPWFGIILVIAILLALLGGLSLWQKQYQPHPELVRKILHIGMGLVTLSFPWLFFATWPVILLSVLAVASLLTIKYIKDDSLSNVMHSVARESFGEIYFPIAIAILFSLSIKTPILFVIPVLILTLADAAAALIGVRYGTIKYTTTDGHKSTEGSIAFFTVAFMSTLIPILLFTEVGREQTLLIALILAMLVMYIEAISWEGLDNLFIPLGGFLLLKVYIPMSVADLTVRLVVIVVLFIFMLVIRKRTSLNDSAVMAAGLVGYVIWAVADWAWFVPALLVFVSYQVLLPKSEQLSRRSHDIRAVIGVAAPALFWLFIAKEHRINEYYFPFAVSLAAQLGMIALALSYTKYPQMERNMHWLRSSVQAGAIVLLPWLFISGFTLVNISHASIGACLAGLAVIGFYYWQPEIEDCPVDGKRFWRQGTIAFLVSLPAYFIVSV